jgi:hypothetical protein
MCAKCEREYNAEVDRLKRLKKGSREAIAQMGKVTIALRKLKACRK